MKRIMMAIAPVAALAVSVLGGSNASAYDYSKSAGTECQAWTGSAAKPYYNGDGRFINWTADSKSGGTGASLKALCPVDSPDEYNDFTLTARVLANTGVVTCTAVIAGTGGSHAWAKSKSTNGRTSSTCGDSDVAATMTWDMSVSGLAGPVILECDLPAKASNSDYDAVCSFVVT
jgi:hypothetical protein